MTRVCIFGDSITWGASDFKYGGWVTLLRNYFEENFDDIEIYNLSISGNDTQDILKRFEIECKFREPDLIIFAIGINDTIYVETRENPNIGVEKFQNNIKELIRKSKQFTEKIVFVGLTKVGEYKTKTQGVSYDNEMIMKYDLSLMKICEDKNIPHIEMFHVIDQYDLEDGLHPNSRGHEKMFKTVRDFLVKNKTSLFNLL